MSFYNNWYYVLCHVPNKWLEREEDWLQSTNASYINSCQMLTMSVQFHDQSLFRSLHNFKLSIVYFSL